MYVEGPVSTQEQMNVYVKIFFLEKNRDRPVQVCDDVYRAEFQRSGALKYL